MATISSQDREIGSLIADAFDKVGKDGVISVEEASTMRLELEFTEGMQFDKGFISAYFVTDPTAWRRSSRMPASCWCRARSRRPRSSCPCSSRSSSPASRWRLSPSTSRAGALDPPRRRCAERRRRAPSRPRVRPPPQGDPQGPRPPDGRSGRGARGRPQLDQAARRARHRARTSTPRTPRRCRRGGEPHVQACQLRRSVPRSSAATPIGLAEKLEERLAKIAGGYVVIKERCGTTEVELEEKRDGIQVRCVCDARGH